MAATQQVRIEDKLIGNSIFAIVYDDNGSVLAHMGLTSFSPVLSEHANSQYRVLVQQEGNLYTIHTGDNMTRILNEGDLPDELSSKLAMIKAYQAEEAPGPTLTVASTATWESFTWSPLDMYNNDSYPSEFNDIGWRCKGKDNFYCVITSRETLDSLRGESAGEYAR